MVIARRIEMVVLPAKRTLGARFAGDVIHIGRQLGAPFFAAFFNFIHVGFLCLIGFWGVVGAAVSNHGTKHTAKLYFIHKPQFKRSDDCIGESG